MPGDFLFFLIEDYNYTLSYLRKYSFFKKGRFFNTQLTQSIYLSHKQISTRGK